MEERNNVVQVEEGALKTAKLSLYEAVAIIVGANIGSGILGLAYSSRLAGWPILVLWLIVAGVFTTFSMLYVAETNTLPFSSCNCAQNVLYLFLRAYLPHPNRFWRPRRPIEGALS